MRFTTPFVSLSLTACLLSAPAANANPTGAQVINGTATIQPSGNLLQITNSPSAIINWNTFSIAANEITRFVQQSSSSAVLNRVVAQNPSSIFGALQSNGRVFLINPSGIVFGAGLIRSSGTLNADRAIAGPAGEILLKATASIELQGTISAIGGTVTVEAGKITASAGAVVDTGSPLSLGQGSGSVCITSLFAQGCEGSASPPTSIVVSTGNGSLAVNGTIIALDASQPVASTHLIIVQGAGHPQPFVANFGALTRAARVFLEGTGQIVDSLGTTSQINDLPLGVGVPTFRTSLAPPRARFVVEPKVR